MNEELQKFILETLKQSKDFVVTQAPDVVQQYLSASAYQAEIFIVGGILFLIMSASCAVKAIFFPDRYGDFGAYFLGIITIIAGTVLLFSGIGDVYIISHYPKAYLLQNLRSGCH